MNKRNELTSATSVGSACACILSCEGCGASFEKKLGDTRTRRFCSRECYRHSAKRERHSCFQHDAKEIACKGCSRIVRVTKAEQGKKSFCGVECWRRFQKQNPANGFGWCRKCGEKFRRSKAGQLFCCDDCMCQFCRDENAANWKGGEYTSSQGHVVCRTKEKRKSGSNAGRHVYRGRHRIVVETVLGRRLDHQEKVWHIDRDRTNDNIENLYVFRSQKEMASAIARRQFPAFSNIAANEFSN